MPNRFGLSCPCGCPNGLGVDDEAPTLVAGGGPAGVVEFAKNELVGLLVGVVVEEVFEPKLPNEKPFPLFSAPPNDSFGVWLCAVEESAGLFGVENIDVAVLPGCDVCEEAGVEPKRPVPGALVFEGCPKLKPPEDGFFAPASRFPPPPLLVLIPPPKGEAPLVAVPLPNNPDEPLVAFVLPKRPPPPPDEDDGVFDAVPNRPPEDGCDEDV